MNHDPAVGANVLAAGLLFTLLLWPLLFWVVGKICARAKRRAELEVGGDDERREDLSQTGRQDADRRRCHVPFSRQLLIKGGSGSEGQAAQEGWLGREQGFRGVGSHYFLKSRARWLCSSAEGLRNEVHGHRLVEDAFEFRRDNKKKMMMVIKKIYH